MDRRILTVVLVVVLMLSTVTTSFAAQGTTEKYVGNVGITLSNITSKKNVILTDKELSNYMSNTYNLTEIVTYDHVGGEEYSLGELIKDYNSRGGVPVYRSEGGPVTLTLDTAFSGYLYNHKDTKVHPKIALKYGAYSDIHQWSTGNYRGLAVYNEPIDAHIYAPGSTFTFDKPNNYMLVIRGLNEMTDIGLICVEIVEPAPTSVSKLAPKPDKVPAPKTHTNTIALPIASKVVVDSKQIEFEAYTINGSSYFKLRDIAQAISKSEKRFDVVWNGTRNTIDLNTNAPYKPNGSELFKGHNTSKEAKPATSKIYKDGIESAISAYTIKGETYVHLRDLADSLDIGVSWVNWANAVVIDTSKSYTVE